MSTHIFVDLISLTERHFRVDDHANLTDQPDQSVQNSSQVPEDHADVVTATAEHGEERVAPWVPFRVLRLSRPSLWPAQARTKRKT